MLDIYYPATMATFHSGYELELTQSANTRRYSNYTENDTADEVHKIASNTVSFPTIAEDARYAENTESANATHPSTPREASIYESNIELAAINSNHDESTPAEVDFSLPPVDGGKYAWLFLLSAFTLEILVWGTYHTSRFRDVPLTLSRFSILLRHLSGVLHISCAVCRVVQYRHDWNLCNGFVVPFFADRLRPLCVVPNVTASVYFDRAVHNVSCFGIEFIEPNCHTSHCHTGCLIRSWWCVVL